MRLLFLSSLSVCPSGLPVCFLLLSLLFFLPLHLLSLYFSLLQLLLLFPSPDWSWCPVGLVLCVILLCVLNGEGHVEGGVVLVGGAQGPWVAPLCWMQACAEFIGLRSHLPHHSVGLTGGPAFGRDRCWRLNGVGRKEN